MIIFGAEFLDEKEEGYSAAGCVATGLWISSWDGPAPLMDIAVASYTYSCAKSC